MLSEVYFRKSVRINITDKTVISLINLSYINKGVNLITPTVQYNKKFKYSHHHNCFGSIQRIVKCVIVGCDAMRKL